MDHDLIRLPDAKGENVIIDAFWYMTQGPGRFALPSLSPLVQTFFARDANGNYLNAIAPREVAYTKDEALEILPTDTTQFSFQ